MIESYSMAIAIGLAGGLGLGAVFFGGLWFTVRKGLTNRGALWFAASYLLRVCILAAGLYVLAHGSAVRAMAAAVGLLVARFVILRVAAAGRDPALT